ncbi:MAG: hypothetical protein PVSMB8_11270 [Vulcanimicrobiaceae bacterium]
MRIAAAVWKRRYFAASSVVRYGDGGDSDGDAIQSTFAGSSRHSSQMRVVALVPTRLVSGSTQQIAQFGSIMSNFVPFPTGHHPPPEGVAVHDVVARLELLDERALVGDRIVEWRFSDDDDDFDQRWVIRRIGAIDCVEQRHQADRWRMTWLRSRTRMRARRVRTVSGLTPSVSASA